MLGGPQNKPGHGGERKNSQPLPGFEPPIIQPVAQRYTRELSRLQKCDVEIIIEIIKYAFSFSHFMNC
jgi:hypothetical protein